MQFLQVPMRPVSDLSGHSTAWDDLFVYLPRTVLGHSPSQCSLTELLARRAEVHLTFNRKLEASVTWLCCAKTVKMVSFAAALPVVRCRQNHSVWVLEEGVS